MKIIFNNDSGYQMKEIYNDNFSPDHTKIWGDVTTQIQNI